MKFTLPTLRFAFSTSLALALASAGALLVTSPLHGADDTATTGATDTTTPTHAATAPNAEADALWEKVQSAREAITNPTVNFNSQDEASAYFRKGLEAFDAALLAFQEKHPTDPRRWNAILFESQTKGAREQLGVPAKSDAKDVIAQILAAPDADSRTKSEASALRVMEADSNNDGSTTAAAAWEKLATEHLDKFPISPRNGVIKRLLEGSQKITQLRTKPLDLKFRALDGREIDLESLRGKVVLIDFWATWCGPCVEEIPDLVKAYDQLHDKGFEILAISLDQDRTALDNFVRQNGMKWPQHYDGKGGEGEICKRFGIEMIPVMWLINKQGLLVHTNPRGRVAEEVEKLLAE